jgi:hypothetical protein
VTSAAGDRGIELQIVSGQPDDVEIAAVTAALLAVIGSRSAPAQSAARTADAPGWTADRSYRPPGSWSS